MDRWSVANIVKKISYLISNIQDSFVWKFPHFSLNLAFTWICLFTTKTYVLTCFIVFNGQEKIFNPNADSLLYHVLFIIEGRNEFTTTLRYKDHSHKSRGSKHSYTLKFQMTTCMFSLVLTIGYQLNPHDAIKSDYCRKLNSKSYDRGLFIVLFWFGLILSDFTRTSRVPVWKSYAGGDSKFLGMSKYCPWWYIHRAKQNHISISWHIFYFLVSSTRLSTPLSYCGFSERLFILNSVNLAQVSSVGWWQNQYVLHTTIIAWYMCLAINLQEVE